MSQQKETLDVMGLVTDVVSAYISNNTIEPAELPAFVQLVKRSLLSINAHHSFGLTSRSEPAVPIEDSIQPDYIVCLEDGKRMKMLKRHLKTSYNMTPDQYRERWGLPINYPMVAPNYAMKRQGIAKKIGLGHTRKSRKQTAA
jgi:predicted transcriptional regulator